MSSTELADQETLTDLIIDYIDNGRCPSKLLLLQSNYKFDKESVEAIWHSTYDMALAMERRKDDRGASLLGDAAMQCFEYAKKTFSDEDQLYICKMLIEDLHRACEEDGIGMYGDSEWIYMKICDKVEACLR